MKHLFIQILALLSTLSLFAQPFTDGKTYLYLDSQKVNPFTIIITGDGFTQEDYDNGFFDKKVDSIMDVFFEFEPYKSYKDYFKVIKLVAISEQRGITATTGNTKFRTNIQGTLICPNGSTQNADIVYDFIYANVAGMNPSTINNAYVIMVAHTDIYGGNCYNDFDNGKALSAIPLLHKDAKFINLHEAGHGIGKLGDEAAGLMAGFPTPMPQQLKDTFENRRQGNPWKYYPNLHIEKDSTTSLWAKYYNLPGYEDVGFFEGGNNNYMLNVWRPTEFSIMNNGIDHARYGYNVIGREAIVRRLLTVAGETFDFQTFLVKDPQKKNLDNTDIPATPTDPNNPICEVVLLYGDETRSDTGSIVLVVAGDGFTADEQDEFMTIAQSIVNQIIVREPYSQSLHKLKIYAIKVISEESGVSTTHIAKKTFFEGRKWSSTSNSIAFNAQRKRTLITRYAPLTRVTHIFYKGGSGHLGDNAYPGEGVANLTSVGITFHELGHAFGNLADERNEGVGGERPNMTGSTYFTNNDTASLRWKHFLGVDGVTINRHQSNAGVVGYGPGARCAMGWTENGQNLRGNDLCAVCLAATTEMAAEAMQEPFYGTMFNGTNNTGLFRNKPLNTQTTITFPSGHGRILNFAFHGCDKLQTLTIPEDVKTIGKYAFLKCTDLKTIVNHRGNPQSITAVADPFQGVDRTKVTLRVPIGTTAAYRSAGWTGFTIVDDLPACSGFNVTFISGGGSQVAAYKCIVESETIDAPNPPTRSGHTFDAWYTDSIYTTVWNFNTDKITEDITLYAKWNANIYKVAFNSQGGSVVDTQSVEYGQKVIPPTPPSREGYGFEGWYREPLATNLWNFEVATVQTNITLYAKWGPPSNIVEAMHTSPLMVHPTPVTNGELRIENGELSTGIIEIFNIMGKRVFYEPFSNFNSQFSINISHLPNATYILRIGTRVAKIIKQ
jgi:uncharacterized repeat protein (TIGR02543 family)